MTPIIIAVIVGVLIGAAVFVVLRRKREEQDGVQSFRRHIDALSPEARREVIERVQHARDTGKGK
jgi:LPXTG-motif cell wall-anchored protein